MWVLLMITIWTHGVTHSTVIGQFTSSDLCKIAEQAMQRSLDRIGDDSGAHTYHCERLPKK